MGNCVSVRDGMQGEGTEPQQPAGGSLQRMSRQLLERAPRRLVSSRRRALMSSKVHASSPLKRADLMPAVLSISSRKSGGKADDADKTTTNASGFDSLPQEVLTNIIARCPADSYPTLKLVSRSCLAVLSLPADVAAVRQAHKLQEQWVFIASSEVDHTRNHATRLRLRVFHCPSRSWYSLPVPKEILSLGPGFTAASIGTKLFIVGGSRGRAKAPSAETWCFDFLTKQWAPRAPMSTPRKFHAMGAVAGKLLVAGGEVPGLDDFCLSEIYDPEHDAWVEIPSSALPAKDQEGWVVNNALYVRHLPDRVYKLTVEGQQLKAPGSSQEAPRPCRARCLADAVSFKVIPYQSKFDPIVGSMDYVTSAEGRIYGCMMSSHMCSLGVFNEASRGWHLLISNSEGAENVFERFESMVCGAGGVYVITQDNWLVQVQVEDKAPHLPAPDLILLSRGYSKKSRVRWRQFSCIEY